MPKARSVQDLKIRYVPVDDADFLARRESARKELIHMLVRKAVAEAIAGKMPSTNELQSPSGRRSPEICQPGQTSSASTNADRPQSDDQPQPPMDRNTAARSPTGPLPEFLTTDELKDLTQARGIVKQQAMLTAEGIPFRVVRSRLLVSREHVRDWLRGVVRAPSRGINLAAVK